MDLARDARRRKAQRAPEADGSGPLPRFALPSSDFEPSDADRTAKRPPIPSLVASLRDDGALELDDGDILEAVDSAASLATTQEVDVRDILGVEAAARPAPPLVAVASTHPSLPPPPPRDERAALAPIDELAVTIPPASAVRPAASRRLRTAVAAAGSLAALLLGIAAMRAAPRGAASKVHVTVGPSSSVPPAAAVGAPPSPQVEVTSVSALPPETAGGVRLVDVAALPLPTTGTVIGARAHRLYVDGAVMRDASAVVPCGKHVVKVGSAGKARVVDVPCGGEIDAR